MKKNITIYLPKMDHIPSNHRLNAKPDKQWLPFEMVKLSVALQTYSDDYKLYVIALKH